MKRLKGYQIINFHFGKETGLGWDNVKNTVDASEEWWENKQLENPLYGKFRNKGLPFAPQLTTLFKDVVANGEFAWAPSCGILPNGHDDDGNDGYHPCLEGIGLDIEEASGDSEDASVGATKEFAAINLNTSQGTISQKSGEKRKRFSHAEKIGKKKATSSSRIAEAVRVLAETCRSRNDAVASASIGQVLAELQTWMQLRMILTCTPNAVSCLCSSQQGRSLLHCKILRRKGCIGLGML